MANAYICVRVVCIHIDTYLICISASLKIKSFRSRKMPIHKFKILISEVLLLVRSHQNLIAVAPVLAVI